MPSELKPCRHLDYDESTKGDGITLHTMAPHYPHVRYWLRDERWTAGPGTPAGASRVQFCGAGRGRINGVFDCYQRPGPMGCWEARDA